MAAHHKLLLADSSATIQRVVELTFADEDVQVLTASDGDQAIARVKADKPDIVLADIGMPKKSGYDVAAFIKQDSSLAHIPVLLLAGAFDAVDEDKAREAGCEGVLVKPFEPQTVIEKVRGLLHRKGNSPKPEFEPPRTVAASALVAKPAAPKVEVAVEPRPVPEPRLPEPPPLAQPVQSLDAYFDRLDAAFAARAVQVESVPLPELPTIADRGTSVEFGESPSAARTSSPIAEAFSALLAVEQGEPGAAPVRLTIAGSEPVMDDELIDRLAKRVVERLGPQVMRDTIADVVSDIAERVIREEIARIRSKTTP